MIVEYDSDGRITHVIHDPVPQHMAGYLSENGHRFLDLPPLPWPPESQFEEDGSPVMVPKVAEDGTVVTRAVLNTQTGSIEHVPEMEQLFAPNGLDSVPCDILTDYVVDGELRRRPDHPASVSAEGRTVRIDGLGAASAAVVIEGETIPLDVTEFEVDEPGPITVVVTPPWPYLEARHDLEIE